MKRIVNVLSILIIVGALFQTWSLRSSAEPTTGAFGHLVVNQPHFIDFSADDEVLAYLTPREQRDQLLDWLLFAAVADSWLSAEEINQVLYDLPAIRYGYMEPVANFEYDVIRSVYIGEGEIVALLPAETPDEHIDQLAHIADKHRKDVGEIPQQIWVMEYTLDLDARSGALTRKPTMAANDLFTAELGYYEATIRGLADMEQFMQQIDDVTYAKIEGDYLTLGGRKLQNREYRNIRVEDIAAIWQSEQEIQRQQARLEQLFEQKAAEYESLLDNDLFDDSMQELLVQGILEEIAEEEGISFVDGSGFSLDPQFDYEKLSAFFEQLAPALTEIVSGDSVAGQRQLCEVLFAHFEQAEPEYFAQLPLMLEEQTVERDDVAERSLSYEGAHDIDTLCTAYIEFVTDWELDLARSAEELSEIPAFTLDDIETARIGLTDNDEFPLQYLVRSLLVDSTPGIPFWATQLYHTVFESQGFRIQAARYDGNLQGTEVGMVLFYTDLLAKIWAIDYLKSAPDEVIPGFAYYPTVEVSPIYGQEGEELTSVRLWFGPNDQGFQMVNDGQGLLFARNASQIYAASPDPENLGGEVQTSAFWASSLTWWNSHYEEVARYEQEYERLNEIMKWSLLISWLNDARQGSLMGYLADVHVDHTNWFPEWVTQNPKPRFTHFDTIAFYSRNYADIATEAMPILYSPNYENGEERGTISGGVSLANKQLFQARSALPNQINQLIRRSNVEYGILDDLADDVLRTFDDVTYSFARRNPSVASVTAKAADTAKLRGLHSEIVSGTSFERTILRGSTSTNIQTRVGNANLGNLNIRKSGNGFSIGWQSRDMDLGQVLGRRMSASKTPTTLLSEDPNVVAFLHLAEDNQFLVKFKGAQTWVKYAPETNPSATIANGWQSRVAEYGDDITNYNIAWIDDAAVSSELQAEYVVMESVEGVSKRTVAGTPIRGPPTGSQLRTVTVNGQSVQVHVDPNGRIYTRWPDLPEVVRQNPRQLFDALNGAPLRDPRLPTMLDDLADGRFRQFGQQITDDPQQYKRLFAQYLDDELRAADDLLAQGDVDGVLQRLNQLTTQFGAQPEIALRRGMAFLEKGNLQKAAASLNETKLWNTQRWRTQFFDEINARLAQPNLRPAERVNLQRMGQYAEWQNMQTQQLLPEGQLSALVNGDELAIALQLTRKRAGVSARVALGDAIPDNAIVYVDDSLRGIPNLDWSTSIETSVQEVISSGQGVATKLPAGDIAHFRPAKIYMPEGNVLTPTSQAIDLGSLTPNLRYVRFNGSGDMCQTGQYECQDQEPQVYLVYASNE